MNFGGDAWRNVQRRRTRGIAKKALGGWAFLIGLGIFVGVMASTPLLGQSVPPALYAESFRHGPTSVTEETFEVNLTPKDALKLFNFLEIGDVVQYPNADGPLMQLGDGYGAWNVPWGQWLTGGLYRVS